MQEQGSAKMIGIAREKGGLYYLEEKDCEKGPVSYHPHKTLSHNVLFTYNFGDNHILLLYKRLVHPSLFSKNCFLHCSIIKHSYPFTMMLANLLNT